MNVRLLAAAVLAFAAAAAAAAAAGPASAADEPSYAGAESCRKCHAAEHARWNGSAHALTTRPASEDSLPPEVLRGASVNHAPGRTEFSRDALRFGATVLFDDGKPAQAGVDFVVGLRRMRMLVARLDDGRCQVLPAMREEPGGTWFDYTQLLFAAGDGAAGAPAPVVAPGEPSFWTGPDRSFDARCARCHVSGSEVRLAPDGARGARSSWRALGVDCETCHGPASQHVAHWRDGRAGASADPIVRLAQLPQERSLGLCLSCHLEGEPVDHAFRPGDDLFAHADPTLLDDAARVDPAGRPLELIYEGLSFLSSACAADGLTCGDCHDAHGSGHRSALTVPPDRVEQLCARCHAEIAGDPENHTHHPADAGVSCTGCHMPLVTIERGHGAVHDHSLGAPRPAEDGRDACSWCHQDGRGAPPGGPFLDAAELAGAFRKAWPDASPRPSWRAAIAAGREGRPGAGTALRVLASDRSAPRVVRASAAKLLGRAGGPDAAELPFLASDSDLLVRRSALQGLAAVEGEDADRALLRGLRDPSLAVRTAAARAALEGFRRMKADEPLLAAVVPVLEEDAEAAPEDHARWFRLGCAKHIAGDARGALAAFERKLQLDPAARLVRRAAEEIRRRLAQ